jgi:hypothetical protein
MIRDHVLYPLVALSGCLMDRLGESSSGVAELQTVSTSVPTVCCNIVLMYAECVVIITLGHRYVSDDGCKEVDPALEEHVEQTIIANEHVEVDAGQAGHRHQR